VTDGNPEANRLERADVEYIREWLAAQPQVVTP
jgi:hypothetical protein